MSKGFGKKNFSAFLIIGFSVLLLGGYGVAQTSSGYDVSIGSNGIELGSGVLDVQGNDIVSSGTTVFDGSAGQVASAVVDYSAATASDVGLGNVENIALSTIGGNDITWDGTNNELDVDSSTIQSGTTSSDVGLGNVENEAAVAESGDTMTGVLNMNSNISFSGGRKIVWPSANSGDTATIEMRSFGSSLITDTNNGVDIGNVDEIAAGQNVVDTSRSSSNLEILTGNTDDSILLDAGNNNSFCQIDGSANINCDGSKNWIHVLGNGSEAVYSSQESPQVRAVYEGKAHVTDSKKIELPEHFSMTVSDSKPMLRVQATPHKLAQVAVTERTDDFVVIEASNDVMVDYRVTGIREGYEDKQVVRIKE